jgi:hypothetical protein
MANKTALFSRQRPGGILTVVDESNATGNVFWVDSGNTSQGGDTAGFGDSPDTPFLTLDFAVGQCTANNQDRIFVMPGHAETLAAASAVDVDVAGVEIIGLGNGPDRPTFTLSATGSTFEVAAAGCLIRNLLFTVTADSTIVMDINTTDTTVEDCEFRYGTAKEFVTAIDINGGAANACDRTTIRRCLIHSQVAGSTNGIELGEVADRVLVEDCMIWGDWTNAAIHNPSGKILTNLMVRDCFLQNTQTGDHAIELASACTGMLLRNAYYSDIAAPGGVDPGSCFSIECYHADAIDTSGILAPVAT